MNTANLSRYVLLAAIAAVGFMLLVEFNQFKNERQRNAVLANQTVAATVATVPAAPVEAAVMPVAINGDESIPQVSAPAPVVPADTTQTIRVRSDVLDLVIDLRGGDVVHASLPAFLARLDTPDQPFVLLDQSNALTYIAQSGLVGPGGTDTPQQRPLFQVSANTFALTDGSDTLLVDLFLTQDSGARITKRFTLTRGSYLVRVDYLVNNQGDQPWQAALYGQLKRDSSRDPSAEDGRMGVQPFLGVASTTDETRFEKIAFSDLPEEKFNTRKTDGWIAVLQHYFLGAWVADKGMAVDYSALQSGGFNYARFTTPLVTVAAGEESTLGASLYLGPKDQYVLEKIAANLDLSVDYGWLWWIAQPLFWVLDFLHGLLGNWGFAVIALTVLVKALFFPLSAASYRSMANMRRIQPKLVEMKERFGDDRQKMSQAMMELYRKEKINPLGGCLPILVQMPVFIALYWVLLESVELRHAPFIGYIDDLSAMDPYFILPLIMGASMFLQMKLNPAPPDPMQAKIMQWMPVVFTVFFLWFPAGLVLYWVVNNVLSIAQQWVITRRIEKAAGI
ncbi:MAG: membrane protein insertase YidC [Gammaproteobacteria bacterium]|nr:MAG: membrane protein insertase YidC [Gammaproteobacteria bacterium]